MSWRDRAACKGATDLFFPPEDLTPTEYAQFTANAKAICMTCPVRLECLAAAGTEAQGHGVWGGMTAEERKQARRRERRAQAS